jgi:hypothetical protein
MYNAMHGQSVCQLQRQHHEMPVTLGEASGDPVLLLAEQPKIKLGRRLKSKD